MKYLFIILLISGINAQILTVDKFLDYVKKNNKDILIAAKTVEISHTQRDETQGLAYPNVSAEVDYKMYLKPNYLFVDMPGMGKQKFQVTKDNDFSLQTVLTQTIFNYTVFTAIRAAKEYEELTNHTYQATVDAVLSGSKKAFYQTLLLKNIFEVKKSSELISEENYKQVKNKFDNGLASKLELLQAEVRWKNSIPETQGAERNLRLALNSLKSLAGFPMSADIAVDGNLEYYPEKPENFDLTQSLSRRADFQAMVWENNLRTTNIEVETSNHFPTLYASFAYRFSSQANKDEYFFSNQNNTYLAGLNLRIPIFNGWQTSSKVQRAKIEVEISQLRINKFKEKVENDLSNISLKLDEAKKRIESAKTTMVTANQAFEIASVSAMNGLATQLELKDASFLKEQTQLVYYLAVFEYLDAYFDYEFTTGLLK